MLKPGVAIRVKAGCTDRRPNGLGLDGLNGVIDHLVEGTSALYAIRLFTKINPYSPDGCFYVSGADLIEIGVNDMYPEVAKYCENDIAVTKEYINNIYGVGASNIHNVKLPEGHIVIDFDIKDESGNKSIGVHIPSTYFKIKKVIYNDPATIVFWKDGTKTVVKACEDDEYDPEKGLAMAISKKALGNKGNYYETFKKALPKKDIHEILQKLHDALSDTVRMLCK